MRCVLIPKYTAHLWCPSCSGWQLAADVSAVLPALTRIAASRRERGVIATLQGELAIAQSTPLAPENVERFGVQKKITHRKLYDLLLSSGIVGVYRWSAPGAECIECRSETGGGDSVHIIRRSSSQSIHTSGFETIALKAFYCCRKTSYGSWCSAGVLLVMIYVHLYSPIC